MPDVLEPPAPDLAALDLTIQEMAIQSGLSEHTLRYYERIGLIAPIPRHRSSGHRRYTPETARIVESLACLRATGMPLEGMRKYLQLRQQGRGAAGEQVKLFKAQKAVLERESEPLERRLAYLKAKVAYWEAIEAGDANAIANIAEVMPALMKRLNQPGEEE